MSLRHSSSENRSARWIVSTTPALATTASQPPSDGDRVGDAGPHGARSRTSKAARDGRAGELRRAAAPGASHAATVQPLVAERVDDRPADPAGGAGDDHAAAARRRC